MTYPKTYALMFTVVLAAVFFFAATAFSAPVRTPTQASGTFSQVTLLNATTTSATSTTQASDGYLTISGAKKVNFILSRAWNGGNSGSSRFSFQVSNDLSNWYDFNKLVQNVASSTDGATVSSVTISAATSTVIVGMDLRYDAFQYVRAIAVETTDGEHTVKATAEF
jgi:hypothetical protein